MKRTAGRKAQLGFAVSFGFRFCGFRALGSDRSGHACGGFVSSTAPENCIHKVSTGFPECFERFATISNEVLCIFPSRLSIDSENDCSELCNDIRDIGPITVPQGTIQFSSAVRVGFCGWRFFSVTFFLWKILVSENTSHVCKWNALSRDSNPFYSQFCVMRTPRVS